MNIKVQSETISFEEFAKQHPDEAFLVPDSFGVDGGILYELLIPCALDLLKDLIKYIAKTIIENRKEKKNKNKKEDIVFVLGDEHAIRVPVADFDDIEKVIARVKEEYGKNNP